MRPDRSNTNRCELVASLTVAGTTEPELIVLRTNLDVEPAPDAKEQELRARQHHNVSLIGGPSRGTDQPEVSPWMCTPGSWLSPGLLVTNVQTGQSFPLAFDTVFISWSFQDIFLCPTISCCFGWATIRSVRWTSLPGAWRCFGADAARSPSLNGASDCEGCPAGPDSMTGRRC